MHDRTSGKRQAFDGTRGYIVGLGFSVAGRRCAIYPESIVFPDSIPDDKSLVTLLFVVSPWRGMLEIFFMFVTRHLRLICGSSNVVRSCPRSPLPLVVHSGLKLRSILLEECRVDVSARFGARYIEL